MPPRKSTSVTLADLDIAESETQSPLQSSPPQSHSQSRQQVTEQQLKARAEGGVNVEDYLLPRSLTLRLAKVVLPPNTTIQKDAVLAIQKAATVFVSYLSSHANEATLKRTVAPSDVFNAISELEFDGFRSRLEKELDAYTDLKAGKRKKGGPSGVGAEVGQGEQNGEVQNEDEENTARGAKRVKRVSNSGEEGTSTSTNGNVGDEMQEEADKDNENEDDDVPDDEEEEPEEEQEEEEEEEEEDANDEGQEEEEEDINRVEDLDRESQAKRTMDPDVAGDDSGDSEDETGPGSQLKEDMGSA